jgi:hypothetical protein
MYQRCYPPVSDEIAMPACVLRTRPYGESDLIVRRRRYRGRSGWDSIDHSPGALDDDSHDKEESARRPRARRCGRSARRAKIIPLGQHGGEGT